jgi:hypothetical protein
MPNDITAMMDAAAEEAEQDFQKNIAAVPGSAKDVAVWVKKWYAIAGYKRLSKILLAYADK